MIFIHYNPSGPEWMVKQLGDGLPELDIRDFPTLESLFGYLEHPLVHSDHLALLAPRRGKELERMIAREAILADIQSILLLPAGTDTQAMRQAHVLNPRVMFCGAANLKTLQHILSRMIRRQASNNVQTGVGPRREYAWSGPHPDEPYCL